MKKFFKKLLLVLTIFETHLFMGILYFLLFPFFKILYHIFSLLKIDPAGTNYRDVRDKDDDLHTLKRGY